MGFSDDSKRILGLLERNSKKGNINESSPMGLPVLGTPGDFTHFFFILFFFPS